MADGGHQQFGALHSAYQVNHIYIKARLKRSLSDPCFLSRNCLCPIKEEKPPKNMYHTPSPPPPLFYSSERPDAPNPLSVWVTMATL